MSASSEGKKVRVVLCETGCGKPATMFRRTDRRIVCGHCVERFPSKGFDKIEPGKKSLAELLGIKEADLTEQELAEVIANAGVPEPAGATA